MPTRRFVSIVTMLSSLAVVAVLGLLDYITGYDLGFFVFYLIPVALVAWFVGKPWAVIVAALSALCWFLVDFLSGHPYPHPIFMYWNAIIRFLTFFVLAMTLATLRQMLERERGLRRELQKSFDEVKVLRGFLPICASCKKIRNDQGLWEQVERYIADRSDAEFTHSICPECAKKLYPELCAKMTDKDKSSL